MTAWVYLILAGLFEMTGVVMINKFHKDRTWQSFIVLLLSFGSSFGFLAIAMKSLPMGTAYAIWTGIGASGGAVLGMLLYGESKNGLRILFIIMILSATIGLKVIA
ncbi:multidrug efflux SMR transporter [Bacillus sp. 165]|uniref:DMT family transporter n=1 Tax=Bacillus sp. 165 TaxID=1529117 RepID=UPI001ADA5B0D|nr:multidrug efflux SMR transporter [Bacillus sp. 165]MBO9130843.1 multidrug efflux SMR transporter [Bacillus sp. 165]